MHCVVLRIPIQFPCRMRSGPKYEPWGTHLKDRGKEPEKESSGEENQEYGVRESKREDFNEGNIDSTISTVN